jgi:hypothetical protein
MTPCGVVASALPAQVNPIINVVTPGVDGWAGGMLSAR